MQDHGPDSGRYRRLARQYAEARDRADAARRTGDDDGRRYATAEARRVARILAEG